MSDESTQEMLGTVRVERPAGAEGFARRLGRDLVEREQSHATILDTLRREVKEAIETLTERVVSIRDTSKVGHATVLSELGTLRKEMDRDRAQRSSLAETLAAVERRQTELLVTLASVHKQLDDLALDVAAAGRPPWWRRWLSGR
jgi:septal ring factor EnvC (AmiA/AmiB activator)